MSSGYPVPLRFMLLEWSPLPHWYSPCFPTRRSSDLHLTCVLERGVGKLRRARERYEAVLDADLVQAREHTRDRKSTRLNSSHVAISYAVFCLKKKKKRRLYKTVYKQSYQE